MPKIIAQAGRFFRSVPKWLLATLITKPVRFFRRRGERAAKRVAEWKAHPKAFLCALRSFFVPGWGQLKNRQWYKAIPFLVFFAATVGLELATSDYFRAAADMERYPVITRDMIEGGAYYQTPREEGTIVGGLMLTTDDVAVTGAHHTYRVAGDYVAENGVYVLLEADDVETGGTYFES